MTDLDSIRITMDLERLGEFIAAIGIEFARIREIEELDVDGEEMRRLALYGWNYVCHMADRAAFVREMTADLDALDTQEGVTQGGVTHRSEFDL